MGQKKMSKSEESDYSRINLSDSPDLISKKIKKAKTDSGNIPDNIKELEKKSEAFNLLNIYSEIIGQKLEKALNEMSGKDFSFLKDKLSEVLVEKICPIGKKMDKLMQDKSHLENIIKKGTEKANIKAEENIKKIREIIGFV